jgi:hypothetical protein
MLEGRTGAVALSLAQPAVLPIATDATETLAIRTKSRREIADGACG